MQESVESINEEDEIKISAGIHLSRRGANLAPAYSLPFN